MQIIVTLFRHNCSVVGSCKRQKTRKHTVELNDLIRRVEQP